MANCAYHPERDSVGACVNCGQLICAECKVVLTGKIYCNPCADKLFTVTPTPSQKVKKKATYSMALRWVSGIFGFLLIMSAINGLSYFAESGLVSELIVDIVTITIAIAYFMIAFVPHWVSAKFKINLQKKSAFLALFLILVAVYFIVGAFGPEPPGGWWNYEAPW